MEDRGWRWGGGSGWSSSKVNGKDDGIDDDVRSVTEFQPTKRFCPTICATSTIFWTRNFRRYWTRGKKILDTLNVEVDKPFLGMSENSSWDNIAGRSRFSGHLMRRHMFNVSANSIALALMSRFAV